MNKIKHFLLFAFFALPLWVAAQTAAPDEDFYTTAQIRELKLTFRQANWAATLDSFKINGSAMLLGDLDIDGVRYANVGVRYRGSASFKYGDARTPFYIKLNYINKTANHKGVTSLVLSTALRDPSMVREVMGYEIARKYMPAPKANYAKLTVNNDYRGLYVNLEAMEEEFLKSNFNAAEGTFIKCSSENKNTPDGCKKGTYSSLEYSDNMNCYLNNYELISKEGWGDLVELIRVLNETPNDIEKHLNVDRALWMLAFNNAIVNLSSYSGVHSQNYYLYKDAFGQFNPILWDLNLAFGSLKTPTVGSDVDLKGLQELDPLLHVDNVEKPLINQLLKNPSYKNIYLSHLRSIISDNFESGWYERRTKELQEKIRISFMNDKYKYYKDEDLAKSLNNTVGERSKIPGLTELMGKRTKFILKHPALQTIAPTVTEVKVLGREKLSSQPVTTFRLQTKVEGFPKRVRLYYRADKKSAYTEINLNDDGKSADGEPGDKIFGATIDPQGKYESIDYYFLVENAQAVSFYPVNYMKQPLQANLTSLNK